MASVGWLALLVILIVVALVQTPWVPQEQIDTKQGVVVGYVLSVDSGYLNALTDDSEFVIIVSDGVIS